MRAVLVHGFNVKDAGAGTVDQFIPELEKLGYTVDRDEADYGFWSLRAIYFGGKRKVIRRLMKAFEHADVIITHSNGASFANKALKQIPPRHDGTRVLVHFSPALNRKTEIPFSIDRQWVYHTRKDWTVRLSSYLPGLPWGRMGAMGYKGDGPNINVDRTETMKGHSNWFKGANAVNYPHDLHDRVKDYFV